MALFRVLGLVACRNFNVTERFPYSLIFSNAFDCSAYFRLFDDTCSGDASEISPSTVDGEAQGSGDDVTVKVLPEFRRNRGDPMGCDLTHVDLTLHLHSNASFDMALTKRTSFL